MNNKLSCLCAFILGSAIGAAVTWKVTKTKYERIANEEIDSVKETYFKKKKEALETMESLNEELKDEIKRTRMVTEEKPNIMEYAAKLQKEGYTDYSNDDKSDETTDDTEDVGFSKPYIIYPEEFGELYGYSEISLTYYADGVLTDDVGEIIEDVDDIIGIDSLLHFGEYEDDSVFVRNDRLKCDYEILLDPRNYYIGTEIDPHLVEV